MRPRRTPVCRHCRARSEYSRHLCKTCFRDPAVRGLYPADTRKGMRFGGVGTREPSAEEVERIVAEQLQCLPWWWGEEAAKQSEHEGAA